MKLPLTLLELNSYLNKLINNYLPIEHQQIIDRKITDIAIQRTENCFSNIHRKYYNENGIVNFNHLNSDHMVNFLWFLSNSLSSLGRIELAEQVSYLNKIMHGIDAWHNINLPDIFLVVHPVGTILGNAKYNNFLVVYQNVTVGADLENGYPKFDGPSILYSKSSVIGDSVVGENVILGANALAVNQKIKKNSVYIGNPMQNEIKESLISIRELIFGQKNL